MTFEEQERKRKDVWKDGTRKMNWNKHELLGEGVEYSWAAIKKLIVHFGIEKKTHTHTK
jgi:hypothetical protein